MKRFNVSADCKPNLHYMVNIEERLKKIKEMVDSGEYFTINRARQYGKTTTLKALGRYLKNDYVVISLDFQKLSYDDFASEQSFSEALSREILSKNSLRENIPDDIFNQLHEFIQKKNDRIKLADLFLCFSSWCAKSSLPVVLIIDEIDSASNNQVFLDFLAMLRGYYIDRDETPAFWSVILAGVYDVKNLKRKFVQDDHKLNSPWNIAADFLVDLSFSTKDISGMLNDYREDHQIEMDTAFLAGLIYDYTSGYPYLVSRICKLIDERIEIKDSKEQTLGTSWTKAGILEAVRILLNEQNPLFDSLINKLEDDPQLEEMLRALLFQGKEITYTVGIRSIEMALMFGFVKKTGSVIVPANRIFEILLYNLFLSSPRMQQNRIYHTALKEKNQFVSNGHLNMELILKKFVLHFHEVFGDGQEEFLEKDGRRYFLLYLKPIINGTGNYYIESQTRDMERTDVIVDYCGEQFVIELKIWRGNAYHERGERQLSEYLDYYHLKKGYMLSFNFNKKKQIGVREIPIDDKLLIEAVV